MNLDFDSVLFISFLILNLVVGLFYSRGVKNAKEYAIGDKKFTTSSITLTIVASVIGAGFFSAALIESYKSGLLFIIPSFGEPIALILMGIFLVPKMSEFLNDFSIADSMGKVYGKKVKLITAASGVAHCIGVVALQFKVALSVMQVFFEASSFTLSIIVAVVVIVYSAFSGIKGVTFTDVLQFMTFGIILPVICIYIWKTNEVTEVSKMLSTNPLFDYRKILDVHSPQFFSVLTLFIFFVVPSFQPVFSQRVSMASSTGQAKKAYISAGFITIFILSIICWTSILLLSNNPDINPENLLSYVLTHYTFTGLKGLAAISIMAIIMSTADSYLNSGAVLLIHDFIKEIKPKAIVNELLLLRLSTVLIGCASLSLILKYKTLLTLLVLAMELYMPIVTMPMILTILGLKANEKIVLISMGAGLLTTIFWSDLSSSITMVGLLTAQNNSGVNSVSVAMTVNTITYLVLYFFMNKPKYDDNNFRKVITKPSTFINQNYSKLMNKINSFHINALKYEYYYSLVGLAVLLSLYSSIYIFSKQAPSTLINALEKLYYIAFLMSFVLLSYMTWSKKFKTKKTILLIWNVSSLYLLLFIPSITLIISNFDQIPLILFLINIVIFASLVRWQLALPSILIINYISMSCHNYILQENLEYYVNSWQQFKMLYSLALISFILIAFLKPKQEEQEISEEIADHLSDELEYRDKQIVNLSNLKQTFFRNLQHETNTPVTGIYSMSQALGDCYDKLSDEERKKAIKTITLSSERLISYVSNLIDFSKIINSNYNLNIKKVNLSCLLEEVLRKCIKLYIPKDFEENREIKVNIPRNLVASCDEYYVRKSYENLIINAIQYCKKGNINVTLSKETDCVKLTVTDSGIGIPEGEHNKIFQAFTVSGRTLTPAGGRGMGLTLVKAVAEIHGGIVEACRDMKEGSKFIFSIPS